MPALCSSGFARSGLAPRESAEPEFFNFNVLLGTARHRTRSFVIVTLLSHVSQRITSDRCAYLWRRYQRITTDICAYLWRRYQRITTDRCAYLWRRYQRITSDRCAYLWRRYQRITSDICAYLWRRYQRITTDICAYLWRRYQRISGVVNTGLYTDRCLYYLPC